MDKSKLSNLNYKSIQPKQNDRLEESKVDYRDTIDAVSTQGVEVEDYLEMEAIPPSQPLDSSNLEDMRDYLIKFKTGERGLYSGQMKQGDSLVPHGKGTCVFDKGKKYEGDFRNGHFEGQGTYSWNKDHSYTGQWKNHEINGKGTYKYPNGAVYTG